MHELSICESVLQVLEQEAAVHGAERVIGVRLEIGRFAGVEPEALRFGFDVVTRGTVAEGARLEILDVPGRAWCFDCSDTVPVAARHDCCPRCNSSRLQSVSGDELRIKDMEVA